MPSPFPGMDPYLEGSLWPDVHQRFATEISEQLTPRLRPRYVARLAVATIIDMTPEAEIGLMYPDVEVVAADQRRYSASRPSPEAPELATSVMPPITSSLTVPILEFVVRTVSVEIYTVALPQLVTSIEILSPVNKREPGLTKYRQKQRRLYEADIHLVEIDFIRRGTRPTVVMGIPPTPYLVTLTRAQAQAREVWPIRLQETLPVIALPLRPPDADVPLDLSAAMRNIYDKAAYDLSLDYSQPPPSPALSPEEEVWVQHLLSRHA